jgi:SAM-dependent methyltransferase
MEAREVVEFWDRRPCNIRHSQKPVGTLDYFSEVTARRYKVEPHIPGFAQFARWKDKRVLEIGCGIGTDGAEFARAGAEYYGHDISQASLGIAKQRFVAEELSGAFFGPHLMGPVEEASFDLIYSFGVIHHAHNPRLLIAQARDLIKLDGEFRLMLYAANSWKAAMIEAGLDQPEAQSGCPIARTYTYEQVEKLLAPHFRVESIEQAHIFPWKVEDYVEHRYVKQPWFEAMPVDVFEALERRMGWHLLIMARPV